MNAARTPMTRLLAMAVRAEMDSEKTYNLMAHKVRNPLLKEKFRVLAFEEKKHAGILRKLFASLYPEKKPVLPAKVSPSLLPSVQITAKSSLAEILYQAMNSEKAAQRFYAGLARRVSGEKKKMLLYLSKVEKSHFLMLKGEYSLALVYEDYAEQPIEKVVT